MTGIWMVKKEYDLIVSLGAACSCTETLRECNLQRYSYPFDWLYGNTFEGRVQLLLSDMKDFINKEDLEKQGEYQRPIPCTIYKNTRNNLVFNHDFPQNSTLDESYTAVFAQYSRRINRLFSQIKKSKSVLFVYIDTPQSTTVLENDEILLKAQRDLQNKFFDTKIDILYISNSKKRKYTKLSQNVIKKEFNYALKSYKNLPSYLPNYKQLCKGLREYKLSEFLSNNKSDELVSVLIPVFNNENQVQNAINSVLSQSYKNIELIVIDDGSTDSSRDKIFQLESKCKSTFKNTVFITREHKGTVETLNDMINMAKGKYISILSPQNRYKPEMLSTLQEFLSKNIDYSLAAVNSEFFGDTDNAVNYTSLSQFKTIDYKFIYNTPNVPAGYLVRRDIFKRAGFFTSDRLLIDWYLFLQISKYSKLKYINKQLFECDISGVPADFHYNNYNEKVSATKECENNILRNVDLCVLLPKARRQIINILIDFKIKPVFSFLGIINVYKIKQDMFEYYVVKLLNVKLHFVKKVKS